VRVICEAISAPTNEGQRSMTVVKRTQRSKKTAPCQKRCC